MSSGLVIRDLVAGIEGRKILNGISLEVPPGQVTAVMGPNGSGKSTLSNVIMGRGSYRVDSGSATLEGKELLGLATHERARAGLFLISQYPSELPGVTMEEMLEAALESRGISAEQIGVEIDNQAALVGFPERLWGRFVNVDLSGGEKKRSEVVQMAIVKPKYAILDEIDSGLDIDALRAVARRVREVTDATGAGVLVITHYARLLKELNPETVLVLSEGTIKATGDIGLALELEKTGYLEYRETKPEVVSSSLEDLFGTGRQGPFPS